MFDFRTSDDIPYEVKADRKSAQTGNFFIEYDGYGKPSGIKITTANRHILLHKDQFYMAETGKLKELIRTDKYRNVSTKDEDNNLTFGRLVPVKDVEPYATLLPLVTPLP